MNNVYLDYAASSAKHFDIFKETIQEFENFYANPSSAHSLGKKNNALLKKAREVVAKSINANPEEIIFLSGGTEANNTVFNHIENKFSEGEIIISEIEHPSTNETAKKLEEKGFKIIKIKTNKDGIIDLEDLKKKISSKTILISVMFANNETGVIQPIDEIGKICLEKNILLHSDIVQAYCKTEIDVKKANISFASVSAHKIGGTGNFGFLYAKNSEITKFILGSGQENNLRAGSVDVMGAVILQKCIGRTLESISFLKENKDYFIKKLSEEKISYEINGCLEKSLPNILNVYFPNIETQRLMTYLDANNIYVSGGAACGSGNIKGSKIINTMYDEERATHSVRISIGFDTTKEMIDYTIEKIKDLEMKILARGKEC